MNHNVSSEIWNTQPLMICILFGSSWKVYFWWVYCRSFQFVCTPRSWMWLSGSDLFLYRWLCLFHKRLLYGLWFLSGSKRRWPKLLRLCGHLEYSCKLYLEEKCWFHHLEDSMRCFHPNLLCPGARQTSLYNEFAIRSRKTRSALLCLAAQICFKISSQGHFRKT